MYALKQIDPTNWQNIDTLKQFYSDLAKKPYCTDSKGYSHIRTKTHAIKHAYIQPNHPDIVKWLIFDIDDPQALFAYHDNGLPSPQVIIKNPENGHAHYAYRLTTPVGKWQNSSTKPIEYLASVQKALRLALGADKSYGGNLMKNPCSPLHDVFLTGAKPSYTLAELAEYLELQPYTENQEPANDEGYGRNCSVFNYTKDFGYKYPSKNYNVLVSHLTPIAEAFNLRFDVPLSLNEIWHIVRSISRYCTRTNFNSSDRAFSQLQTARVAKRWGDNTDKRKQANTLKSEGLSCRKIAERLNVGKSTVARWLN